jgi:hypothetical protein
VGCFAWLALDSCVVSGRVGLCLLVERVASGFFMLGRGFLASGRFFGFDRLFGQKSWPVLKPRIVAGQKL